MIISAYLAANMYVHLAVPNEQALFNPVKSLLGLQIANFIDVKFFTFQAVGWSSRSGRGPARSCQRRSRLQVPSRFAWAM